MSCTFIHRPFLSEGILPLLSLRLDRYKGTTGADYPQQFFIVLLCHFFRLRLNNSELELSVFYCVLLPLSTNSTRTLSNDPHPIPPYSSPFVQIFLSFCHYDYYLWMFPNEFLLLFVCLCVCVPFNLLMIRIEDYWMEVSFWSAFWLFKGIIKQYVGYEDYG